MYLERLVKIVTPSEEDDDKFKEWSNQTEFFNLLANQLLGSSLILYASSFNHGSLLIKSILVPVEALEKENPEDMPRWDSQHYSWSCGLTYGGGRPPHLVFDEPLARDFPTSFRSGQPLVFSRSFVGRTEDKDYYEVAQFLAYAHDLHWTPEREAWCRLDSNGDVEEVIRLHKQKGRDGYGSATCITIDRQVLEMQMSATGTALVQMFDLASVGKGFSGWNERKTEEVEQNGDHLYFRSHREGANGGWARGVQIVRPKLSSEEFGQSLYDKDREPKQYASFIAIDWKNDQIAEVSCAPDATASYFEPNSKLPFQISPVFFNPAVLDKYKADLEKYSLQ